MSLTLQEQTSEKPLAAATAALPGADPRIARSKQALAAALIGLIEEKGFDAITVNDLCTRASLNRGTFYNHYRDKEALLIELEDALLAELANFEKALRTIEIKDLVHMRIAKRPIPFLVDLFDSLRAHGPFLHAALGPGGDPSFAPKLRDAVCTNLVMSALNEHYRTNPTPFVNYYVSFYASAYLGVITRWVETGMDESSEDMARIAMRLLFIKPGESIEL